MICQYIIMYQTKPRAGISAAFFFFFGGGPLKHGDRGNGRENYKISIFLRTVALVQERCSCGQVNQWLCLAFRW